MPSTSTPLRSGFSDRKAMAVPSLRAWKDLGPFWPTNCALVLNEFAFYVDW